MKIELKHLLRGLAATAAFGAIALPATAQAQDEQQIQGTIAAVTGTYSIQVDDANGYLDNVALHDGTIINPTGLTLAAGQTVTILGEPDGNVFVADEIDTPYATYPAPPAYYAPPAFRVGVFFGDAHARHFGRPAPVERVGYAPQRDDNRGNPGFRHTDVTAPVARAPIAHAPVARAPFASAPANHEMRSAPAERPMRGAPNGGRHI
jgi:hypothetical protein